MKFGRAPTTKQTRADTRGILSVTHGPDSPYADRTAARGAVTRGLDSRGGWIGLAGAGRADRGRAIDRAGRAGTAGRARSRSGGRARPRARARLGHARDVAALADRAGRHRSGQPCRGLGLARATDPAGRSRARRRVPPALGDDPSRARRGGRLRSGLALPLAGSGAPRREIPGVRVPTWRGGAVRPRDVA